MTQSIEPPEGYSFLTVADILAPNRPIWEDPNIDQTFDYTQPEAMGHIVAVHDVCGCFVMLRHYEAHEAWHASIEASS